MARMRVVSLTRWGEFGIQVNFELMPPIEGRSISHTEMALPENVEFNRLLNMKMYEEYDVDGRKVSDLVLAAP